MAMKRPKWIKDQPTWGQFVLLIFGMFLIVALGAAVLVGLNQRVDQAIEESREQGLTNRAIACMEIIHEGEITLTDECVDPAVAAYYPPDICTLIPQVSPCGREAVQP